MAINEKVGILTHAPGETIPNPGLVRGIYMDFLTRELDFLDDSRNFPLASDFTSSPAYWFGYSTDINDPSGDWEDLATSYRGWRDAYLKASNEYWLGRAARVPLDRLGYDTIAIDPAPWKNNWQGSNPIEWIRRTVPSPVDGSFNYPDPNFPGAGDHYAYFNTRRGLFHRYLRCNQANLNDMADLYSYKTGDSSLLDSPDSTDSASFLHEAYRSNRDRMVYLLNKKAGEDLTTDEEAELATRRADFLATDQNSLFYSLWDGEKAKQFWAYYVNNYSYYRYSYDTVSDYTSGNQIDTLTIWPEDTTIAEALGATGSVPYNRLPAVKNFSFLPETGSAGDVIMVMDFDEMAWDPIRGKWSFALFNRFFSDILTSGRATRDAKLKADNEFNLAMRPLLFSALYIPAFQLTTDGNINSELKAF